MHGYTPEQWATMPAKERNLICQRVWRQRWLATEKGKASRKRSLDKWKKKNPDRVRASRQKYNEKLRADPIRHEAWKQHPALVAPPRGECLNS